MAGKRNVIVGLDGAPSEMIVAMTRDGIMPNLGAIIAGGELRRMNSTIPDISNVAWSSIITGENPGVHGIFGFTDLARGTYQLRFPNYADLKARPFWERCSGKSVIINVPSTYPVRPMNGVHISGFVSIDLDQSVHPKSLAGALQSMDYRLDVDSQKAHVDMAAFLVDVDQTLEARIAAYRHLWDFCEWKNFMLVFTGTDRLMHFLWEAWEDAGHKYHGEFVRHFRRIDEVIGEIAGRLGDDDELLLLSDHGFGRLDKDIYVNRILLDEGMLRFEPGADKLPMNIAGGTRVFAMDPARLYINTKGRFPKGSVDAGDRELVIAEMVELFGKLEVDGRKVIRSIHRGDEIYSGPYAGDGPDLVLIAEDGFNLKGAMGAPKAVGRGLFSGMHRYDNAFVASRRKETLAALGGEASVRDVGAVISRLATSGG